MPRPWRSRWTRRRRWPWAITLVGGKTRTGSDGKVTKGWDHDPPAKAKLVPFGILMVATGALILWFARVREGFREWRWIVAWMNESQPTPLVVCGSRGRPA